jgi:hypothetical protein
MNNTQLNKYNMYVATRTALHTHQTTWTTLTGFADSVDDLDTQLAVITSLAQVQAAPNGGVALKNAAVDSLIGSAYPLAAATRAYAVVNKDAELAAQLDLSPSELGKGRPQEVVARCRNVWSTATDNQAASLAFGVTATKLTNLKKRIDEFEAAHAKPRAGQSNTKAATQALPDAFAQVDEILKDCLDGLMPQFKDSTPEFFNEYFAARRIVNTPGSRSRNTTPAPAPTPTPV